MDIQIKSILLGAACLKDGERPPMSIPKDSLYEVSVTAQKSGGLMDRTKVKIIKTSKGIFVLENARRFKISSTSYNGLQLRLYVCEKRYYIIFDNDNSGKRYDQPPIEEINQNLVAQ